MADVVLTTALPAQVEQTIAAEFECETVKLREVGPARFLEAIGRPRALVVAPGDRIDAALIDALPGSVRLLASYSTGLDHVDLAAADGRGLTVSSTPDVLTDATADIAMLLILSVVRGANPAARLVESNRWGGWSPNQIFGRDLGSLVLGIVGGGRIGAATARRAAAFGMKLAYWGRSTSDELTSLGAAFNPKLDDLLPAVDVLSLHVPSSSETRGLVDARSLSLMRSRSYLINTARGDLVDDEAVLSALASGKLAGVGLDVFRGEPRLHPSYRDYPNVYVLPHIGSATEETRGEMGRLVLEALRRHLPQTASRPTRRGPASHSETGKRPR